LQCQSRGPLSSEEKIFKCLEADLIERLCILVVSCAGGHPFFQMQTWTCDKLVGCSTAPTLAAYYVACGCLMLRSASRSVLLSPEEYNKTFRKRTTSPGSKVTTNRVSAGRLNKGQLKLDGPCFLHRKQNGVAFRQILELPSRKYYYLANRPEASASKSSSVSGCSTTSPLVRPRLLFFLLSASASSSSSSLSNHFFFLFAGFSS